MSLESDIKKKLREKYYKEHKSVEYDYKQWLLDIARSAGMSKNKYDNFMDIFSELIEQSRFLDTLQIVSGFTDSKATLSRFISYLEGRNLEENISLKKYDEGRGGKLDKAYQDYLKNPENKNLVTGLNPIWHDTSFVLQRYHDLFKVAEKKMKEAYIANTNFEKKLNTELKKEINNNQRYYSFFQLDKTGKQLADVISVRSDLMDKIIQQTNLVHLRIIPQSKKDSKKNIKEYQDWSYSLSLGIDSSNIIEDIMNAARQVGVNQTNGVNLVKGIFRDNNSGKLQKIGVNRLQEEFEMLYNKSQGADRTIINQTGGQLKGNRLTEILFNRNAIDQIQNGASFMHIADQLSSMAGLDTTYASGGGASVKTFGGKKGSTSIQLMSHDSVKSIQNMFFSNNSFGFIENTINNINIPSEPESHIISNEALNIKRTYYDQYRSFMDSNHRDFLDGLNVGQLETFMETADLTAMMDNVSLQDLLSSHSNIKELAQKSQNLFATEIGTEFNQYVGALEGAFEEYSVEQLEQLIIDNIDEAEFE